MVVSGHLPSRSLQGSGAPRLPRAGLDRWIAADVVAKCALVALLALAVWHRDWARFADKAMLARALAYPVAVFALPLAWVVRAFRRPVDAARRGYPAGISLLLTLPFLVDIAGNALDLYDRVDAFDDICHYVNWLMLCCAIFAALATRTRLPTITISGLTVGAGAVLAIGWELAEYFTFVTDTPEQFTIYRDTIGDLVLGLAGSATAAAFGAFFASRSASTIRTAASGCVVFASKRTGRSAR